MRRREFGVGLGAALLMPLRKAAAETQRLVGVLMNGNSNELPLQGNIAGFTGKLRKLGWVEGKNLRLEIRWNGGNAQLARTFASELTALSPAAIMAASTTNLLALKNATSTVPIVFLQVSDPVAQGFVPSVTKPGGNITGFSVYEFSVAGKWLELLTEIAPKLERVALMVNPDTSPQSRYFMRAMENAGPALKLTVELAPVRSMDEIERTIERFGSQPNSGIIVPTDSYTRGRGERIAELALKHRVPVLAAFAEFIDQGGLMYYGPASNENLVEQFENAATYVDRILRGGKPGDLPIQGASKFSLFINRKTATTFGLEIPPRLLFTADKVIE